MDIELARTFLAIVDSGNFNRAAEIVCVTQSTVSTRVKTLEDEIGQELFVRGKSGTTLTAAGARFLKHAQGLVRTWEQARHEVALPVGFDSVLVVGGQFTLWDDLLLPWLPWMRAALPDVAIQAEMGSPDGLMRQLTDGLMDLAVMYTPQSRPGIEIEELTRDNLVLVSSSATSAGPGTADYVHVDWGPEFRLAYVNAFPDIDPPTLSVSHGPLGLHHILNNGGSGYFPLRNVAGYLDAGTLHRVAAAPQFSRPSYLVFPESREKDERFKTALQGLRFVATR
ncbi:MAG: LysR family transcriptional regulator [Magnetospiraceae bacterium]